jgi:hypothetical protein
MANEIEWSYMSSIVLEASGASVANAGFDSGDGSSITAGAHGDWPLCDLELYIVGFGADLAGWQVINVYRRAMDMVGGADDAVAPSATYKNLYVGSFSLMQSAKSTTSTGFHHLPNVPLSNACIFYIENTTGQQLTTGWGLWCRPKSYIPGA